MNTDMPGFTAEASLCHGNTHYRATMEANSRRGVVQPTFYDMFHPDWPVLCVKHGFSIGPTGKITPNLGFGVWDPITNRCR
jgi:hypothetical protein